VAAAPGGRGAGRARPPEPTGVGAGGRTPRGGAMSDALEGISPETRGYFGLDRVPFDQVDKSVGDLLDLRGRRAVVTGGGGADLGQAICHRFARLGASIAVLDVDGAGAKDVVTSITDEGGTAVAFHADVTDWDGIHAVMQTVTDELGGIDILVNNAGGALRLHGLFRDMTPEAFQRQIAVNLLGVIYATRAVLPHMTAAGKGRVINIASEGGKIGLPNLAVYNACKSAVIGLTRNLAIELAEDGISVVGVCPGIMMGPHAIERFRSSADSPSKGTLGIAMQRISLGRVSLPEEVANVVAFLASEAGSYVHGTSVSVGGGLAD
jgi:NAD(P)-dependent dehydrogenase (short-subunit alcohol dehydrogenase family)